MTVRMGWSYGAVPNLTARPASDCEVVIEADVLLGILIDTQATAVFALPPRDRF